MVMKKTEILSWGENVNISVGRFCSIAFGLKLYCGGNLRTDWISPYPFDQYGDETDTSPVFEIPTTNGDICIVNDVWIGRDEQY